MNPLRMLDNAYREGLRNTLYEASVIFLLGVSIALCISALLPYVHHPSLEGFKREYKHGTLKEQETVAEKYLTWFSPLELNTAIEEQNAAGTCHDQGHALGRAVYIRNPNFTDAVKKCGSRCSYGCVHGAIMQMFSTDSDTLGGVINDETPARYLQHVKDAALDLCTRPEVESVMRPRYCFHGIGHVFGAVYGSDIKKSISSCGLFTNTHAATSCRNGVFMEYLNGSTTILFTKDEHPCDEFPEFRSLCYRYKANGWISVWGGVRPALSACDSRGENVMACIRNTAEAAATTKLISNEAGVESICGALTGDRYEMCITGVIRKTLTLNDGDDSVHACDAVAPSYRARCLGVRETFRKEIYYED